MEFKLSASDFRSEQQPSQDNAAVLKNIYQEKIKFFSSSPYLKSNKLLSSSEEFVEQLAFVSTGLSYLSAFESVLCKDFSNLFKNQKRLQVIRHEAADVWGYVLTLKKSLENIENILTQETSKAPGAGEISAMLNALIRNMFDTLYIVDKFVQLRLGSKSLTNIHSYLFSLVKSNSSLSTDSQALAYVKQLS